MDEKPSNRTMLLLTDLHGRILAVAQRGESVDKASSTGINPLPGQSLYEVEVPDEVFQLQAAHEVYQWARRHYVRAGEKPQLRPITELLESVPYFGRLHPATDRPENLTGK